MTASTSLLADFVADQTYQVVVVPNSQHPDRSFQWTISRWEACRISDDHYVRMVAAGYQYPQDDYGFQTLAILTTPPVTDDQAKEVALAWLAAVEGVDSATVDCLLMLPGRNERLGAE